MENYVAEYFREFHEPIMACDAGMWIIALTNSESETWTFDGLLIDDLELCDYKLSALTRKVLEMPELWLFDGGVDLSMVKTVKGDITKIDDVEAIVNAANNSLLGSGALTGQAASCCRSDAACRVQGAARL